MPTFNSPHPKTRIKHYKSTKKKSGTGGRFIVVLVGQEPYFYDIYIMYYEILFMFVRAEYILDK